MLKFLFDRIQGQGIRLLIKSIVLYEIQLEANITSSKTNIVLSLFWNFSCSGEQRVYLSLLVLGNT